MKLQGAKAVGEVLNIIIIITTTTTFTESPVAAQTQCHATPHHPVLHHCHYHLLLALSLCLDLA